jgi:hypothetical protein
MYSFGRGASQMSLAASRSLFDLASTADISGGSTARLDSGRSGGLERSDGGTGQRSTYDLFAPAPADPYIDPTASAKEKVIMPATSTEYYHTLDPVVNFRIRVTVKKIADRNFPIGAANLAQQPAMQESVRRNSRSLPEPDQVDIRWQQKIFSPGCARFFAASSGNSR